MKTRALSGSDGSTTPFLNTLAVETWDTWFRWRVDGQLRDITIDDTWERVAAALVAGPRQPPGYKQRLVEAFAAWHLLLDERIIATAGTVAQQWSANNLRAVLNVAGFVRAPGLRHASFDYARFEEVAALAVHALDDAVALAGDDSRPMPHPRVGVVGMSDALALLDLGYDSDGGRAQAANIAQTLAQGCLVGAIALACDRGAQARCDAAWSDQARHRDYPKELIDDALRHGLRQRELTAVTSQPRLASFANAVADALDPLPDACREQTDSYAATVRRRTRDIGTPAPTSTMPPRVAGQLRMRAAVQPWIDDRINYPLHIERAPSAAEIGAWSALARELHLGPLSWRFRERSVQDIDAGPASCNTVGDNRHA